MSSGVKVDSECVAAYHEFKLKKDTAFIIYGFNKDNTKIVVLDKVAKEAEASKNAQWQTLVDMLPADDVRYAVADVNYNTNDGPRTEIVFISWAPDTSSVKRRMLSASSKETLKNILVGCKTSIQACSKTDMELRPIVLDKFKGTLE